MSKRQREERTADLVELEARKNRLKEFARKRLESLPAHGGNSAPAAAQAARPSQEILRAIDDEKIVSIGSVYGSALPSARAATSARQRSLQAGPAPSAESLKNNVTVLCGDIASIMADDSRPNFKVGTAVLVRNAETSHESARGMIRAVIHGGYSSAKYDVALSSRGGDRVMAHWKDVRLADPEERSGRDTVRRTGSGDVDMFGRKIQPPKVDPVNDKSFTTDYDVNRSMHSDATIGGRIGTTNIMKPASVVERPLDKNKNGSCTSSAAPPERTNQEATHCVINTETVLRKSGGWRNRGRKKIN